MEKDRYTKPPIYVICAHALPYYMGHIQRPFYRHITIFSRTLSLYIYVCIQREKNDIESVTYV